jgi:hypothetical protein
MICPNITSPEWKALVNKVGENRAWKEFLIYGNIPNASVYNEDGNIIFRSIRTKSTEQIAAGINKDLIRSQNDLKYTSHIMASVLNTLGDIAPNKKLDVSPSAAFNTVKGIYTEVTDNLKMALNGIISSDKDLVEVKASESYNEILNEFPVLAYVNSYEDMVRAAETYDTIVSNFDKYKEAVIAELARKGIRMRMDKNTIESVDSKDVATQEADDTENTEISQDEIGDRYDRSIFETNPRDTASVRVKALLQTIKTGEFEMGIPVYADPSDVFADILQAGSEMALSGYTDASSKLQLFRLALEKRQDARSYLKDFIKKINLFEKNNEWDKINDILTFATKAFANETLLLYKTRKDGNQVTGITDVKVINSNRDTVEDQVSREWLEAHKQSGFFNRSSLNELTVNPAKLERLGKIIEEGKTAVGPAKTAKFKEFFSTLGIDFTNAELSYITPRLSKALGKGKDFDIVFTKNNLLDNIYRSFKDNASQAFEDNYGFQDEKASMRKLATLYYEANPGRYKLASAKTADGKQKYLYILTNFIEKKKRQWNLGQYTNVTNSALARPNRTFWDRVKNGIYTFIPQYFNGIREQQAGKDGKVRKSLTDKEQTVTMLLKHQENLNTATYINFTLSDKTTTIETKMTKEFFVDGNDQPLGKGRDYIVNEQGELDFTPDLGKRAYDAFVAPEVSRILVAIKYGKDINLENFDIASKLFYFVPSLNSNPNLEEFRNDLYSGQMNIDQIFTKHGSTVGQAVIEDMRQSAEQQIDNFLSNGILKVDNGVYSFPTSINGFKNTDYVQRLRNSGLKSRDAARLMMMDMKLNYMNTQVKMIQFLRFDPALAFKKFKGFTNPATFTEISTSDRVKLVASTWDEFSKRAAALIAPGSQGSYNWKTKDGKAYSSPSYDAVTVKDVEYEIGDTENTITDAQEYITLNEHIDNLMSEGKIPLDIWQSIYDKIETAGPGGYYELSGEEIGYVFTPTKPVQVNDVDEGSPEAGLNRIDYVKSSRYPLIPQHEVGSERDKMRSWMERNNIRAINFASGKKLGRPIRSVTLFNENGSQFIEPSANDTAAARQTLSRDGLRTQQEIPHQKDEIRTVSQMNRTLFDNMLEESFSLKGIKKMSGTEAKSLKELVRARLFDLEAQKLNNELGNLNRSHRGLHRLLKDVIVNDTTGSYGENDLKSIELDEKTGKFAIPLEQQFKLKKFQGLINSLINKNVMLKVEGSSFVQVSGVGAKYNFSSLSKGVKSDIIWTDSYAKNFKDGDAKLNYIRKEGDQVKPAQVIVSQYLRDKEGNLIDLSKYITEKNGVKILDTSKFSPEMFELVGTRIPNQSHPSMLPIEVVGFLPAYMENTIIVPDGITGQMGSDFDVDKLYTYISKMEQQGDKFIPVQYKLNSAEDVDSLSEEQLGQLYRDIHWMALTHPAAYDKITKSIDMPEVKRKVAEREAELEKYQIANDKGVMLPLDFMTSINRFNDNRSGKVGVGVFANLISAQADFQDKVLRLGMKQDDVEKENPIKIKLSKNGKVIDLLYLGQPGTSKSFVGKTRTISENLNIMFTESVDNAKNQFLREFNWEEKAMSAIGVFEMLTDVNGNAVPIEFVMDLTSQEAIKELFTSIDQKQDSFGEYDSDALETATLEIQNKIAERLKNQGYFGSVAEVEKYLEDENRDQALDPETLEDMWLIGKAIELPEEQKESVLEKIVNDKGYTSVRDMMLKYNTVQYDSLNLFKRMEDIGRELNTILGSVYTYTKGIGPTVFATRQKLSQLNKLSGSTNFLGMSNIAGVITRNENTGLIEIQPQGEIGASINNSLMVAQDIYNAIFPISSGKYIESIVDNLMENQGKTKEQLGKDSYINLYDSVFNGIKAYLYTMPGLELFLDSRGTRDKLINGDTSLGKRIMELSKDPKYKRNGFIKNLEVKQAPKQKAFTVSFKAPFGTDLDEKSIISGFYELAVSDKEEIRQLAKDLAIYPFVTGDAGNMGRFIPVDYYRSDEDFSQVIAALDRVYSMNMDEPGSMEVLIQQIIQNNPEEFTKTFKYSTYSGFAGSKDNVFKRVLKKLVGKEELKDVDTFTIKIGDFEADPKGKNIANSLKIPLSIREGKDPNSSNVRFKYPPYILINDTFTSEFIEAGSRNVNYLYKRVSPIGDPNGTYERINILGYNGIKEYDFNNPELVSAIEGNNNVEDDVAFQETVSPAAPVQEQPAQSTSVKTYTGKIESLELNQVFVFGSNTEGRHGAGSAKTAKEKFGAKYGQYYGSQGQSFAIITKDLTKEKHPSRTKAQIIYQVERLYDHANLNPDKEFMVAYSATGKNLNGYSAQEMADMFSSAEIPSNIVFEEGFSKLLNKQGVEISSNSKGLAAALTNPTELAKQKGNLTQSYPVTFDGVTYKDAEEAYQRNKGKYKPEGLGKGSTYDLMVQILEAKLKQHPRLTEEITKVGGMNWLSDATHQPTGKNTVWETGGQNLFINALQEAYYGVTEDAAILAEQNEEQKIIKAPQEDQETLTPVTYAGTKFLAGSIEGTYVIFYAKEDGSRGAIVKDPNLDRKVQLAHASELYPERVVKIQIGPKENSYYVSSDNKIYSLQSSSFGDLITSDDVTRRVMQHMNTPMQEKQVEQQESKKSTTTFTYKNITVPTEFQLSAEQSKALENIIDFVEARSAGEGTYDGTYTLEGYAGTGKTSIIGILDRYISQKSKGTKFIYMAPTHAATVALGNNIVKYGAKELPMTIQSAVTESRDPMKPGPKFTKKFTDRANGLRNVIVLDEASMLANKDFEKLILAAKAEGFKIVFMGDPKQIPEVMSNIKTKELAKAFANPNKSILTNVFRTKDNNILTVLTNIRNNSDFVEMEFESTDSMKQLNRAAYNEELISDLQNNLEDVTIINYTNDGVAKINKAARNVLGHSGPLKPGEKIVGYLGSQTKQVEKGHLANSVSYMVKDVSVRDEGTVIITATSKALEDLQKAGMRGFPTEISFMYLQLSNDDSLDFGLTKAQLDANNAELKRRLKNIHQLNELYQRKGISYPNYLTQVQIIRTELAEINTGAKYIYNPVVDNVELYDKEKHKGLNSNLEMDKGIDFGYGITVHKSQGMTIPIVYFDTNSLSAVGDITITRNGENFNTEKNALYYVGMSRASRKLVVPKNTVAAPLASQADFTDNTSIKPQAPVEVFDPLELVLNYQKDEAIDVFVSELFGNEKEVKDSKSFLNKLFKVTSTINQSILTAIGKTGAIQPVTFKIDMSQPDPGTYNRATRTITINPKAAIVDAVDIEDMKAKIHEVIMHELVHHVTVDLLLADQTALTPEQRKWVKSINNLFDQVQVKMLQDPQHSDKLMIAMSTMSSEGFMSAKDKSLYYGLTSIYDFVTMMLTDKGFQQFMNNVNIQGNKTILDRFMDLLMSLVKSLGIQVKDQSALDEGLRSIIGLIGSRNDNNIQKSISTSAVNKNYIEDNFNNIINVLNIKTKC